MWSNNNSNDVLYYQECLTQCPNEYEPEEVTKYCIEKSDTSIAVEESTTVESTIEESTAVESTTEETLTVESKTGKEILPKEQPDNCFVLYEGKCYLNCPYGTCLSQNNIDLKNCVPIQENTKVFNDICFENFKEITKNIKSISDKGEVISNPSGVIIRGYSTKSDNDNIDPGVSYSIVDLGDCEGKLKEYYKLDDNTELYILGIDSPNKNKSYTTNVYNYGVYLGNGTQLDHLSVCKDSKISISSVITNPDLVKLEDVNYFSDLGYDIYDENKIF